MNLPKVLKLKVQVEVAHSRLRIVSMLVTCLPLDASPEETIKQKKTLLCSVCCAASQNVTLTTPPVNVKTYSRGSRSLLSW